VQLSLYDVVVFIDDSGSMLEGSKWRDLQAIVQQIVEITTQFDTDGIQVGCTHSDMRAYFKSIFFFSEPPPAAHGLLFQMEFMNSDVRADNVTSASALQQIFARVRPMGFTPLASSLERKVLEPYYEMLRSTPAANVKPMVIYICSDGAPTTERGLKTYQPTFTMLGKVRRAAAAPHTHPSIPFDIGRQMDSMLQSLGLPRKTIGINVTQIGLDEVCLRVLIAQAP
jgi:hypothetical protein